MMNFTDVSGMESKFLDGITVRMRKIEAGT
jgi:hypothetical protein